MKKYLTSIYLPAMLGASIEYYDLALYGYMAPILASVFLPGLDKTAAYFYYFLFEFFAALCQIGGAKFFGAMGDTFGRKRAMYQSMMGTSCVTFLICLAPTFEACGYFAAILFALLRALQSFFLGGEYNGGVIYCLEHERDGTHHGLVSGVYCFCTVSGIIFASFIATLCSTMGHQYFRLAYGISFVLAIVTYSIRTRIKETPEFVAKKTKQHTQVTATSSLRVRFFAISLASLFFGIVYGLPTRILNAILPLSKSISTKEIMVINTISLVIYMCFLLIVGAFLSAYAAKRIMCASVLLTGVFAYPLLLAIDTKALLGIIIAKAIFVFLAALFIVPFHCWAQQLFPPERRYKGVSTGYCIGKCATTIVLAGTILVFERYQTVSSLSLIFLVVAVLTLSVFYASRPEANLNPVHDYRKRSSKV